MYKVLHDVQVARPACAEKSRFAIVVLKITYGALFCYEILDDLQLPGTSCF